MRVTELEKVIRMPSGSWASTAANWQGSQSLSIAVFLGTRPLPLAISDFSQSFKQLDAEIQRRELGLCRVQ